MSTLEINRSVPLSPHINFRGAVVGLSLVGCSTPAMIRNDIPERPVDNLKASSNVRPIQIAKVVVRVKRGEIIGAQQSGIVCFPNGNLLWNLGRVNVDSEELTDALTCELNKYSFKMIDESNVLLDDSSTLKSEIILAGVVRGIKANYCFQPIGLGNSGVKGEASLSVDWRIYSTKDRAAIYMVTTDGISKNFDEAVIAGQAIILLDAFSMATRNLMADEKFRVIVSGPK